MAAGISISRRHLMGTLAASPLFASTALAASARADRVMVQGRPQDTSSRYKFDNIMPALDRLGGVRKMRCREPYSGTAGWPTYVSLGKAGVKFCFTLAVRPIAKTLADLRAFLRAAPGSIWAIEFPNEPDLNPVAYKGMVDARLGFRTGNAPALMAFIRDFAAAIRADAVLGAIPLVASNDFMQAEQAAYTTYGNSHIYPTPAANVSSRLDGFGQKVTNGRHAAGIITEWGRTTGGNSRNVTSPPVSLQAQATLLASDVNAALQRPYVKAISIYELFCWSGTDEISNFGLFNADLSPRPVVAAIKAVLG